MPAAASDGSGPSCGGAGNAAAATTAAAAAAAEPPLAAVLNAGVTVERRAAHPIAATDCAAAKGAASAAGTTVGVRGTAKACRQGGTHNGEGRAGGGRGGGEGTGFGRRPPAGLGPPERGDGAPRDRVAVVAAPRTDGVQGIKYPPRWPPSLPLALRGRAAGGRCPRLFYLPWNHLLYISTLHWLQRTILACDWTVRNVSIRLFSWVPLCEAYKTCNSGVK